MYKNLKILAVIPARGGSKGIPKKNIKILNGKPLIAYSIESAKRSKYIDSVAISTDSGEIAEIAKNYGADVPFLRPAKLATDSALTLPSIQHAYNYYLSVNKKFDLIVIIQPTSPLVLSGDMDSAIEQLFKAKANSCVSVCEVSERPEWMRVFKGSKIRPFITDKFKGRQDWPKVFRINGAIYVTKPSVLIKKNKILDENTTAIIMPKDRSIDIDEETDFKIAEIIMSNKKNV